MSSAGAGTGSRPKTKAKTNTRSNTRAKRIQLKELQAGGAAGDELECACQEQKSLVFFRWGRALTMLAWHVFLPLSGPVFALKYGYRPAVLLGFMPARGCIVRFLIKMVSALSTLGMLILLALTPPGQVWNVSAAMAGSSGFVYTIGIILCAVEFGYFTNLQWVQFTTGRMDQDTFDGCMLRNWVNPHMHTLRRVAQFSQVRAGMDDDASLSLLELSKDGVEAVRSELRHMACAMWVHDTTINCNELLLAMYKQYGGSKARMNLSSGAFVFCLAAVWVIDTAVELLSQPWVDRTKYVLLMASFACASFAGAAWALTASLQLTAFDFERRLNVLKHIDDLIKPRAIVTEGVGGQVPTVSESTSVLDLGYVGNVAGWMKLRALARDFGASYVVRAQVGVALDAVVLVQCGAFILILLLAQGDETASLIVSLLQLLYFLYYGGRGLLYAASINDSSHQAVLHLQQTKATLQQRISQGFTDSVNADVHRHGSHVTVHMTLPGLKRSDLEVAIMTITNAQATLSNNVQAQPFTVLGIAPSGALLTSIALLGLSGAVYMLRAVVPRLADFFGKSR